MRWNLAMAALAASWGFTSVIVAHVDLSAPVLVFFRTAVAAAAVAALLAVVGRVRELRVPHHRAAVALTGVTLAVHWLLFFETIKLSSVAVALVTVYTGPVLLALAAPMVLPEARNRVAVAALVPALAGLALTALAGGDAERPRPLAVVLGLGAAASYALLVILLKSLAAELPAPTVQVWSAVVAAIVSSPFLFFAPRVSPHGGEIVYVLLLGALATGASWLVFLRLLRRVPAQTVGVVSYLELVSAAFLAWALLGQEIGWNVIAGGALIVAAGIAVVLAEPGEAL
jgi:drug/metabolite transporter (DMT)-like permease